MNLNPHNRSERRHSDDVPKLYDIPGACHQLGGISKPTLYRLVAAGKLRLVKIGARSYVTAEELMRYVAGLVDEAS